MLQADFYRRKTFEEKKLYAIFQNFTNFHPLTHQVFHTLRTAQLRAMQVHCWHEVLKSIAFVQDCKSLGEQVKQMATIVLLFKDVIYLNNFKHSAACSANFAKEAFKDLDVFKTESAKAFEIVKTIEKSSDVFGVPETALESLVFDAQAIALASTKHSFDNLMGNLALENGFTSDAFSFHKKHAEELNALLLFEDLRLGKNDEPFMYFTTEGKSFEAAASDNLRRYAADDWYEKHCQDLNKDRD